MRISTIILNRKNKKHGSCQMFECSESQTTKSSIWHTVSFEYFTLQGEILNILLPIQWPKELSLLN